MSGAYGTGKTYASFVIKHILEDDIASIEPYFIENSMQALLARVKGVRAKGKILVVQKSASAGIDKQNKLFNAIIEAVKETLKAEGYNYTGSKSLLDKVIATLKDPNSAFNFAGAFNKYRSKFTDYDSPQSVVKDLEELDLDEKITNSARKRGEKQKANGRQVLFIRTENECGNKDKGEKLYSGELLHREEKHTRYVDKHSGKRSV